MNIKKNRQFPEKQDSLKAVLIKPRTEGRGHNRFGKEKIYYLVAKKKLVNEERTRKFPFVKLSEKFALSLGSLSSPGSSEHQYEGGWRKRSQPIRKKREENKSDHEPGRFLLYSIWKKRFEKERMSV